jgi:hypothetical protein
MFDAGFEFSLIQRNVYENKEWLGEYIFQFKTSEKRRYIVIIEEYPLNVFVPKFYLSKEKK